MEFVQVVFFSDFSVLSLGSLNDNPQQAVHFLAKKRIQIRLESGL